MVNHITLLIDESGSMGPHTTEARAAITSLLKGVDKSSHIKLIFFDGANYRVIQDCLGSDVVPEIAALYKPSGGTPITDAVYKSIQDSSLQTTDIRQLDEKHKTIIFTDGEENSSKYSEPEDLGRAIEHLTENFGWDFQFIGPKNCERGILNYTNSIKIKRENVTLYSDMSEGLKAMENQVINA